MRNEYEIIPVAHKHATAYLVGRGGGWVLFDALWPDSFRPFREAAKARHIRLCDIRCLFVSHFHPDHAGIAQILAEHGVPLTILHSQAGAVKWLNDFFIKKPHPNYYPIQERDVRVVSEEESRALLADLGMDGCLLSTPGHSPDSASLVLDGLCAFTGDLHRPPWEDDAARESWARIRALGATHIYPAHGVPFTP